MSHNPNDPKWYEQEEQKNMHGKSRRLRDWWRTRMHSKLLRMSRGAQNFWTALPWPKKDNWRRQNKKK